jgi:hypothetical protein
LRELLRLFKSRRRAAMVEIEMTIRARRLTESEADALRLGVQKAMDGEPEPVPLCEWREAFAAQGKFRAATIALMIEDAMAEGRRMERAAVVGSVLALASELRR